MFFSPAFPQLPFTPSPFPPHRSNAKWFPREFVQVCVILAYGWLADRRPLLRYFFSLNSRNFCPYKKMGGGGVLSDNNWTSHWSEAPLNLAGRTTPPPPLIVQQFPELPPPLLWQHNNAAMCGEIVRWTPQILLFGMLLFSPGSRFLTGAFCQVAWWDKSDIKFKIELFR